MFKVFRENKELKQKIIELEEKVYKQIANEIELRKTHRKEYDDVGERVESIIKIHENEISRIRRESIENEQSAKTSTVRAILSEIESMHVNSGRRQIMARVEGYLVQIEKGGTYAK